MLRFGASILLVLGLAAAGGAMAQQVKALWNCKDAAGKTILTDQKADTVGKTCRVVSEEQIGRAHI